MLQVNDLNAHYGRFHVLKGVSLEVKAGEIVAAVGANTAGKSTLLNSVSGIIPQVTGEIVFEGESVTHLPSHDRVERGIVQVPEGRRLFPEMTVMENLELGAYPAAARSQAKRSLDRVLNLLPVLGDRRKQLAGSLSGGEQQMCSIGRALMTCPKLLMLDEPTTGLAPLVARSIFTLLKSLCSEHMSILLVEQNVRLALELASRAYVLENGSIVMTGTGDELLRNERLRVAYLGV